MVSEKINQINGGTCGCHADTGIPCRYAYRSSRNSNVPSRLNNTGPSSNSRFQRREGAPAPQKPAAEKLCLRNGSDVQTDHPHYIWRTHRGGPIKQCPSVSFAHPITHTRLDCRVFKHPSSQDGKDCTLCRKMGGPMRGKSHETLHIQIPRT